MITAFAVSLLAVLGFALVLWRCNPVPLAQRSMSTALGGLTAMMDADLDDDAKEIAVRRAGLSLIGAGAGMLWRFALALSAAALPVYAAAALGITSAEAVFDLMLRLDYLFVISVTALAVGALFRRLRRAEVHDPSALPRINRYSATDRFFHTLAFSTPSVLKGAAALEDRLMPGAKDVPGEPPIFVTSLARGGTTALLNALAAVPGVATHRYRDMPFLTAPLLWNRVAGGQLRKVGRHARAHGDGLEIDLDSPEAFEEVLWRIFWPGKYTAEGIALWQAGDSNPEAEAFIARHMHKVIRARGADSCAAAARYCSKNNANIARIAFLQQAFPGCRIVVPLRRPETHAASLLRQHLNFLKLQQEDEFIRRYMRDIGHFEFGRIHRPLLFPGFAPSAHDPETPDYWLDYWLQSFREVARHAPACRFVLQDDLRAAPQETMTALCSDLGIAPGKLEFHRFFRASPDRAPRDLFDPCLYAQASELYDRLAAHPGAPLTPLDGGARVIPASA